MTDSDRFVSELGCTVRVYPAPEYTGSVEAGDVVVSKIEMKHVSADITANRNIINIQDFPIQIQ